MPKEVIRDEVGLYDVQVGWSREKWVQVGVETADGCPIVERLYAGGVEAGLPAQFTGLWATLDRAGCNRLIRTVRQARDAAFGRDE